MTSGVSGIGNLFGRALDGLRVSSSGMNVVSNNIANANTVGYNKQVFTQGTRASSFNGLLGGGVVGIGVTSFIDPFIERQLVEENAEFGVFEGRGNILANLESVVQDNDGAGIGTAITSFFNSWSELSADPANGALRESVRGAGEDLAARFSNVHRQIQNLRSNASSSIETKVDEINAQLETLADYNGAIMEASDQTTILELKAQRNVVLQELSRNININYFENSDESLTIQIGGTGVPLVSTNKYAVLDTSDDLGAGGSMTINTTIAGGGTASIDATANITGGVLGGQLTDRNGELNDQLDKLNTLAYNLVTQINDAHDDGYGLDGSTGNNFFTALASSDSAAALMSIDPDLASDLDKISAAEEDPTGGSSGVGDGRIANAIVALQSSKVLDGGTQTFSQFYNNMVSTVGIQAGQVNKGYESQANLLSRLQLQRENVSGVNLDEEAADLIKFQRAFEGSARVMSVANEMLDTLLGL